MGIIKYILVHRMKTFIASAALIGATLANSNKDDTTGIFGDADQWKSGLITIEKGAIGTDDMFYWAFESRDKPETDPLVMWLTGGPGCASEVALFYENGPYKFPTDLAKTTPLTQNPESWNNKANLLFVDQPIGTGFSHSEIGHDVKTEDKVASDMAIFLRGYLEENPEYKGRDFYITGESYAGHYVPAIAYYLVNSATDVDLNLKGIAIGNGLTDPFAQYPAYATFSYENDLISEEWDKVMTVGMKACQGLIYESESGPKAGLKLEIAATEFCQLLADSVIGNPLHPKFNVYDIRIPCEKPPLCYDFSQSDTFMNDATVQETLGVTGRKWVECEKLVHSFLLGDWMTNLMPQVGSMLDNTDIEVLVYSGDKDWICNWRGGEAWTHDTKW